MSISVASEASRRPVVEEIVQRDTAGPQTTALLSDLKQIVPDAVCLDSMFRHKRQR